MSVQVTGTVGTGTGAPLDLRVSGGVPLALGNRQLASRGAALQGALSVDMTVTGTAAAPQFSGRVTSEGGGFVDPDTGIVLKNLSLVANVSGDRVVIEKLGAESGEGTVSATGSVGLDPHAGFPIDLTLQVRKARYVDGTLVAARFDADLTLSGSLAEGPLLKGTVRLDRTEVTVPDKLPKDSVAVDVEHVAPPPKVEETLAIVRARDTPGRDTSGSRSDIRLDVAVAAPQRIFVRGRGLDTEFGGNLTLRGPISALTASGAFQMVRGRLDILTQRIAFDRGVITFAGDLDPVLDFPARRAPATSPSRSLSRAGRPIREVNFSSTPELPQDEILARLIFQKGIGELSPLQVARLAAAASELSGGSGGLLSKLRATTGLDDLDIVTDEEGQASVAAGRYVTENVYVGVQQGTTAQSSRVTIDLDVTKNVKARAGMSAEGEFEPRDILREGILAAPRGDPAKEGQSARSRLIHVVVVVVAEPPGEDDVGRLLFRERDIATVERLILVARDRIVWLGHAVLVRKRIFDRNRRDVAPLAGQMSHLGDAGEGVARRIVDRGDRLMPLLPVSLEIEPEATVGKLAEREIEERVDRASVDDAFEALVFDVIVAGRKRKGDVRMRENAIEHHRVAVARHLLECVAEIAVVVRDAHGNARGDGRRQFLRRQSPLLGRIAVEDVRVDELGKLAELFALGAAHLQNRNVSLYPVCVAEERRQPARFRRRKEDGKGGEIKGDREELPIHHADDAVLVGPPFGEA